MNKKVSLALYKLINESNDLYDALIKSEYNKAQTNNFEDFEESLLYKEFDKYFGILAYDYELYKEMYESNINSTSDLINKYIYNTDDLKVTNILDIKLLSNNKANCNTTYINKTLRYFLIDNDMYFDFVDENGNIKATDFKYLNEALVKKDIQRLTSANYVNLDLRISNGYIYSQKIKDNVII